MKDAHGDWVAVKHGDELGSKLKEDFNVQGIPSLFVMKKEKNGNWTQKIVGRDVIEDGFKMVLNN